MGIASRPPIQHALSMAAMALAPSPYSPEQSLMYSAMASVADAMQPLQANTVRPADKDQTQDQPEGANWK